MSGAKRVAVAQAFRKLKEEKMGQWNSGAGSFMFRYIQILERLAQEG